MNKLLGLAVLLILIGGISYLQVKPETIHPPTEEALTHFFDKVTGKVQTLDGYENMGLGGGVDGFRIRNVYPGLLPSDFTNVQAYQGYYFEEKGELYYSGNAASNSGVIARDQMKTLLENVSVRLHISPHTKKGVDRILEHLEKGSL